MKWYYKVFCTLVVLYLIISVVDRFYSIDSFYLSISSLFAWGMLAFISIETIPKENLGRKIWHYVSICAVFLLIFITLFRMIMK